MNDKTTPITVVFDLESGAPLLIGTYSHTEEDTVIYHDTDGERHTAPYDCVAVVTCEVPA